MSSVTLQRRCAWSGAATVVIAFAGWLVAGVLPLPLGPSSSIAEVAAFYGDHPVRFLAGLTVAGLAMPLVLPLFALISVQMLRGEGRWPVLSFLQLLTGAVTAVLLLLPMLVMTIIAFRPDRGPELTLTLNDLAWLLFLTPIGPFILQNLTIAVSTLRDDRGPYPRWVGFMNLWIALSFVPDVLAFFFHSGPFGWNGVLIFWLALTTYSIFLIGMGAAAAGVAARDADEAATDARVPAASAT